MEIQTIHLLILALTWVIMAVFFFSFSSHRYAWAAVSVLAFVALYYGAGSYRTVSAYEPLVLKRN
jgi:hypothetical protein